ncbi:MAG: M48 family metallopeptidase [Myxococcota bacterium]
MEAWYRREARRVIAPRVHALAAARGVGAARVAIGDPRSRWGSCSGTGTLSFSWRLMLAPEHVLDYVIAHEVCHLSRPDHSPAFWALVAETFPGHEASRAWLRSEGALLHRGPAWRAERERLSPS